MAAALTKGDWSPATWDAYIGVAPNFAAAQDRMSEAISAGVSFADLLTIQSQRLSALTSY